MSIQYPTPILDGLDLSLAKIEKLPLSGATVIKIETPSAANTYDNVAIPPENLIDKSVNSATNRFAPLNAFTSVRDRAAYAPKATNVVKYTTSSGTVTENPTTFESGDSVTSAKSISMNHINAAAHTTNAELNQGKRPVDDYPKLFETFASYLVAKFTALLTASNFGNSPVVAQSTAFNTSDAATAYGTIGNTAEKFLLLDSAWFASLNASAGARGFQSGDAALGWNGIYENSAGWSSADPNVHGAALGREAIILAYGSLLYGNTNGIISRRYITLPCGLTVEMNFWFNPASRSYWTSLDCVFGCTPGDSSVATLIKSQ